MVTTFGDYSQYIEQATKLQEIQDKMFQVREKEVGLKNKLKLVDKEEHKFLYKYLKTNIKHLKTKRKNLNKKYEKELGLFRT